MHIVACVAHLRYCRWRQETTYEQKQIQYDVPAHNEMSGPLLFIIGGINRLCILNKISRVYWVLCTYVTSEIGIANNRLGVGIWRDVSPLATLGHTTGWLPFRAFWRSHWVTRGGVGVSGSDAIWVKRVVSIGQSLHTLGATPVRPRLAFRIRSIPSCLTVGRWYRRRYLARQMFT